MSELTVKSIAKILNERLKELPDSTFLNADGEAIAFLLTEIESLNKKLSFNGCKAISKRGFNFMMFANGVLDHIEEYTIPQYGDEGEDQVTDWTVEDCLKAVKKYIARYGKNSREGQQPLDFKKMSHFLQMAAEKHDKLAELEK